MTHANGTLAEQDYDAAGRGSAVRNLGADRAVISIFTYSYDAAGNRTGVAEANGDRVTWSYDETSQLTREQRAGDHAYDVTYSYDPVGNRLTQVSSSATTTYSYDAANELSTSEDSTGLTTFSYDANGNTTGELRPNGDRVTYSWDGENRLTQMELPAGVVNTFALDGQGKRRSIGEGQGVRSLVWDRENIVAEADNAGATVAAYTLAPAAYGHLVSQRRSGASSFHHYDALGSTAQLTGG
jgi:YD repeat-containing protein